MNSYWAERHAIDHINQLTTDAAGDLRAWQADGTDSPASQRPVVTGHHWWQSVFSWLQTLASRSHRRAAQPR